MKRLTWPARWRREKQIPQQQQRRASRLRAAMTAGAGGTLGAAVMYVLDPKLGRRRRGLVRDRTAATARHGWRRVERWSRRAGAGVYGLSQKARHLGQPAEPAANDEALVDRVQSIVFRNPEMPKGRVNINVEDGIVVLRGELDRPEQIQELEAAARKVPGVRDVTNHLHLPHTPAPNKQAAHGGG